MTQEKKSTAWRIPTKLLRNPINEYLGRSEDEWPEACLARRAGIGPEHLERILAGKIRTTDFNIADSILCAMDKFLLWYEAPLIEFYWPEGVPPELGKPVKCANPYCNNWFSHDPLPRTGEPGVGGMRDIFRKKYCRQICATYASRYKRGTKPNDVMCRNGHIRTKENTEYTTNGKKGPIKRCKTCHRARMRESAARVRRRKKRASTG